MPFNETVFGNGHSWDRVIIDEGVNLVKRWELFMAMRYKDMHRSGFKWAIGYGHVEGGENEPIIIPPELVLTEAEASAILKKDLESKARFIRKVVKVPITTYMFNGLVSLVVNIGEGNFEKSPVLVALNEEKYVKAAAKFVRHNQAWVEIKDEAGLPILDPKTGKNKVELQEVNGLTFRRGCEIELFGRKVMRG